MTWKVLGVHNSDYSGFCLCWLDTILEAKSEGKLEAFLAWFIVQATTFFLDFMYIKKKPPIPYLFY